MSSHGGRPHLPRVDERGKLTVSSEYLPRGRRGLATPACPARMEVGGGCASEYSHTVAGIVSHQGWSKKGSAVCEADLYGTRHVCIPSAGEVCEIDKCRIQMSTISHMALQLLHISTCFEGPSGRLLRSNFQLLSLLGMQGVNVKHNGPLSSFCILATRAEISA